MPFKLFLDDNFHYGDETERVPLGVYNTLAEAVSKAVEVVDDYLKGAYTPGMSADDLMASYCMFGEDPFVVDTESTSGKVHFRARDYARVQCEVVSGQSLSG
ncbi:MAG: hypothetical protein ABJB74_06465 [Gemmatimonas sp.]